MKRPLTLLFLAVLLLACVAPPLIGRAVEARQRFLLGQLSLYTIGAPPTVDDYQTGWFTSRARHRLPLSARGAQRITGLLAGASTSAPSTLIVDSVIAHGPWPMLQGLPALARMRSTFLLEGADDHTIHIPGTAVTRIGFGGGGHARFVADAIEGPMAGGQGVFSAAGADIGVSFDRHAAHLRSEGRLGPIEVAGTNGRMRSGEIAFHSDTRPTGHGLRSGNSRVALERFEFTDRLGRQVSGAGFEIDLTVATSGETVAYDTQLELAEFQVTGSAPFAAKMRLTIDALDSVMLGALVQRIQQGFPIRSAGTELAAVVRPGSRLQLSGLEILAEDGRAALNLDLWLPTEEDRAIDDGSELLSLLRGRGQLTFNRPMLNSLLGLKPDADGDPIGLLRAGYLRRDGDDLVSDIDLSGGLLTVNKLPLPLPFAR
ncbi:MAG: DUF945 family protein [Gammaproteobacteria bacterium]